jgi:ATP synthase I subunit
MKTDGAAVARRVYVIMAAVAGGGVAGAWMLWGAPGAWGFALGSVISFGNAWWTHRIALSIGPGGEKPGGASLIAVFRYLLMLALLYVILSYSEIGFLAALAGCFTHIIAVVLEVVFELTYGTS